MQPNVGFIFQEEDSDYLCKLAKLINGIGLQLSLSWTRYWLPLVFWLRIQGYPHVWAVLYSSYGSCRSN